MSMTVHNHDTSGQPLQSAKEPGSVDEGSPDTLGQCLRWLRVFDDMVVQGHDPLGSRVLFEDDTESANLICGH
jgi:hypothetical protein